MIGVVDHEYSSVKRFVGGRERGGLPAGWKKRRDVSWSLLVCVGLSVGTTVQKARVPVMGFLGFLAAPAAFEISRVLHKGAIQALAISGSAGDDLSPFLLALIKGLEYGCLGLALGWVSQVRGEGRRPTWQLGSSWARSLEEPS